MPCCSCHINRREFLELTAAGTAAVSLAGFSSLYANREIEEWDPNKPFLKIGKKLKIQPVLMYTVSTPKKQRSYKSWGGIQNDEAANREVIRITKELQTLAKKSEFPIEVLPVIKVKTKEAAAKVHQQIFDVVIIYPARGGGDLLRSCISKDKDTIIFARQRSGPVYYWYEALSVNYLQTENQIMEIFE